MKRVETHAARRSDSCLSSSLAAQHIAYKRGAVVEMRTQRRN